MPQNILSNGEKSIITRLYRANYNDFMLFCGKLDEMSCGDIDGMTIADFSDWTIEDGRLYSTKTWEDAVNKGVKLEKIGLTGVDNGFITFDKDQITSEDFNEIYYHSLFEIPSGDTRFFLSPVQDNTKHYSYDMSIKEDDDGKKYLSCDGGFYQGFYKLEGFDYQTLPNGLENTMTFSFDIRPRKLDGEDTTINSTHLNGGIFFYIGTRAENKFWPLYSEESEEDNNFNIGGTEFTNEDVNGKQLAESEYEKILTDNKHIFFDRTETGFTVDTYEKRQIRAFLLQKKHLPSINYFPLLDRTETGYTIDNISEYIEENKKEYDVYKDVRDNAFALFVDEDGSIGYKYGVLDCDSENKYSVKIEKTKPGLIDNNQWNKINVRFMLVKEATMRIYIYVNGFLKLISKELPALGFKALDESSDRQQGVPYNISIGGGTLGLAEAILPNKYKTNEYILPLEEDFCGSFIGDIKSFKIINGYVPYSSMKSCL